MGNQWKCSTGLNGYVHFFQKWNAANFCYIKHFLFSALWITVLGLLFIPISVCGQIREELCELFTCKIPCKIIQKQYFSVTVNVGGNNWQFGCKSVSVSGIYIFWLTKAKYWWGFVQFFTITDTKQTSHLFYGGLAVFSEFICSPTIVEWGVHFFKI